MQAFLQRIPKKAKEEGVDKVEEWRKFNNNDWGMHTIDAVDYDIILSGKLWKSRNIHKLRDCQ
jgi:hypothetical protein